MTVAEHLEASTRGGSRELLMPDRAAWLWSRLGHRLPDALGAALMPEHVHLLAPPGHAVRFRHVLTGYTVRFGIRFDVLAPQPAASEAIAFRMLRYVVLNPVRGGLVVDPWCWPWSTLRDLDHLCEPVWTSARSVGSRLRRRPGQLAAALTSTRDPHVSVPKRAGPLTASVEALERAAASILRLPRAEDRGHREGRRLVVQAAHAAGRPSGVWPAQQLECSVRTVRRLRADRGPGVEAMLRTLGDRRLLVDPDAVFGQRGRRSG